MGESLVAKSKLLKGGSIVGMIGGTLMGVVKGCEEFIDYSSFKVEGLGVKGLSVLAFS